MYQPIRQQLLAKTQIGIPEILAARDGKCVSFIDNIFCSHKVPKARTGLAETVLLSLSFKGITHCVSDEWYHALIISAIPFRKLHCSFWIFLITLLHFECWSCFDYAASFVPDIWIVHCLWTSLSFCENKIRMCTLKSTSVLSKEYSICYMIYCVFTTCCLNLNVSFLYTKDHVSGLTTRSASVLRTARAVCAFKNLLQISHMVCMKQKAIAPFCNLLSVQV